MFQIGDKIAYPMHGAGVIQGVENRYILGEEHNYYVLKLSIGDVEVLIPTASIDTIGVRYVVSAEEADEVIRQFGESNEDQEDGNWNKRYREHVQKLKDGHLPEVARITKRLLLKDRKKSLSNAERKMLNYAKSALISELGLSKNMEYQKVEQLLMEKISG